MAKNEKSDQMSPETSPSSVEKSGVRRVNNLPLILAITALALFTALIAMVAVKRSNNANAALQQDAPQTSKKNTDTSTMAKEVIGEHGAGLIQPKSDMPPADETSSIPIAPVSNPDAPPLPPRQPTGNSSPAAPVDPDEQQIRMAKMQQFQEAAKAKTAISLPNQLNKAGIAPSYATTNNAPQTREEMLARIADVRRQMDQQNAGDPNATYQAQLAKARASLSGGVGGPSSGQQLFQASASTVGRNNVQQFGNAGQGDRWKLDQEVQAPRSPFEIRSGAVIPGMMISGVNSDLPGQIMGQVSQNVFDTATGKHLLIPQGTRLVGTYSNDVVYGQSTILIAWQRLVFPDGKALDIGSMPGADSAGYAGFRDQVNNHYVRIFTSAVLMSGVTAGISYSQDRNSNSAGYQQPTMSNELSQALGQQIGQVTAQMIAKNLNIAPALEIRPGYRFNIIVVKDINFTKPYKSFD